MKQRPCFHQGLLVDKEILRARPRDQGGFVAGKFPRGFLLLRLLLGPWLVLISFCLLAVQPVRAQVTAKPQGESEPKTPVTLVLLWQHQAQFAGYYMALEQGFYKAAGLEVSIKRGGPDVRTCDELITGKADFCVTLLTTGLKKRAEGVPLMLLSQVVNRSNFAIAAWRQPQGPAGPEIQKPRDLAGKKISLWEDDLRIPYQAFLENQGISVEIRPQYYTLSLFLQRGVDACSVMRYNEYHRLKQNGVRDEELVIFNLWEHGVVLPEDGIYTLASTWQAHPERCRAFVEASLKGWIFAREHPEQALDVVMRYVVADNLPTNRPHMRWMLSEILRSIFPETGDTWKLGKLSPAAHAQALSLLPGSHSWPSIPSFHEWVIPEARHEQP